MHLLRFSRAFAGSPLRSVCFAALLACACGSDAAPPASDDESDNGDVDHEENDDGSADQSSEGEGDGDGDGDAEGDGEGDADGDGEGYVEHDVSAQELCTELTAMLCQAEQDCCTDPSRRYASVEACVQGEQGTCLSELQPPALDAKTGYSASVAGAQLAALHDELASCDVDMVERFAVKAGLMSIFQGTVSSGGDCTPESQTDRATVLSCGGGSVCRLSLLPPSGECGAERQSGESCVTELECADGLRCDPPQQLGGRCVVRLGEGESCDVDGDCASLVCEGTRCAARTTNGVYCFK
jgi:hypothetical protein